MSGRCHSGLRALAMIGVHAMLVVFMTVTQAAETIEPALYRIFLDRGEDLVTHGDYARVGENVVFSLPLGLDLSRRQAQLVSIPAVAVDWVTTERYADAVRASRYASTRGEVDFARMSAHVAHALNEIAFTDSESARSALALDTRQQLISWADGHYGYRADDIAEIVSLLDAATGVDPGAAGQEGLSLSLVATTEHPPAMPLLPSPTLQEIIERALVVSRLTLVPVERVSVLHATIAVLDDPQHSLDDGWRERTRAAASDELSLELRTNESYAQLGQTALDQAAAYADRADVRGVQSVVDDVVERDAELGHKRPNHLSALLTTLDTRLMDARALRLERDRWQLRVEAVLAYRRDVEDVLQEFTTQRAMLDDIRLLAGPDASDLPKLSTGFTQASRRLTERVPPVEVQRLHELLRQSLTLAGSAARGRYQAIQNGDLQAAWDSAAAAAGALMLFEHVTEELTTLVSGH